MAMKIIEIKGVTKKMRKDTITGDMPGVPLAFSGSKTDVVAKIMKRI